MSYVPHLLIKGFSNFSLALRMSVALFLGCAIADLVPPLRELLFFFLSSLYDYVDVIGKGKCCGMPFLMAGKFSEAATQAIKIASILNAYSLIITSCPSCYRMLAYFYPKLFNIKIKPTIKHIVQIISDAISNGMIELSKNVNLVVTYHDSCELTRHMGIVEEPRKILRSIPGLKFVELERHGKLSTCCGGGGLMRLMYPKISQEIAIKKILDEVVPLGVSTIVTACPFCYLVLKDAIDSIKNNNNLKVMDIVELVLMAMGEKK